MRRVLRLWAFAAAFGRDPACRPPVQLTRSLTSTPARFRDLVTEATAVTQHLSIATNGLAVFDSSLGEQFRECK
jgi:hypothetical protein